MAIAPSHLQLLLQGNFTTKLMHQVTLGGHIQVKWSVPELYQRSRQFLPQLPPHSVHDLVALSAHCHPCCTPRLSCRVSWHVGMANHVMKVAQHAARLFDGQRQKKQRGSPGFQRNHYSRATDRNANQIQCFDMIVMCLVDGGPWPNGVPHTCWNATRL